MTATILLHDSIEKPSVFRSPSAITYRAERISITQQQTWDTHTYTHIPLTFGDDSVKDVHQFSGTYFHVLKQKEMFTTASVYCTYLCIYMNICLCNTNIASELLEHSTKLLLFLRLVGLSISQRSAGWGLERDVNIISISNAFFSTTYFIGIFPMQMCLILQELSIIHILNKPSETRCTVSLWYRQYFEAFGKE